MNSILLIFVILQSIFGAVFGGTSVVDNVNDQRIVGGIAVPIASRPYQVYLSNGCGGSLIYWKIVLTAGHCVVGETVDTIKVRAGSKYASSLGVVAGVAQIVRHSGYNGATLDNDIALIFLKSSLEQYSDTYSIGTIDLLKTLPDDGSLMTVSGYGALYENGPSSATLRAVNILKINYTVCNKQLGGALTSTMFCASATDKDSCQGDSGGPITSGGQLVGIVSWGFGCAQAGSPGVYTSIPMLKNWIASNINQYA